MMHKHMLCKNKKTYLHRGFPMDRIDKTQNKFIIDSLNDVVI